MVTKECTMAKPRGKPFVKGDPRIKRGPGGGKRGPVRTAIPVLRQFFAIVDEECATYGEMGLSRDSICRWRAGKRSPALADFWETAHRLGYDVVLVPRGQAGHALATPAAGDSTHSGVGTAPATAGPARTRQLCGV
jgi:hypothetical protein